MSHVPEDRAEVVFEDFKPALTAHQAEIEANRCLYCYDAPCITACPTAIDIPEFIRKIATGNVRGSARTILASNIFGMTCARVCPVEVLCVGDCVYNEMGVEPIQIGKLQRYATDRAYEEGWQYFEAGESTGHSVGIIGGGPAGLAAAHRLRRFGHAVTLYEAREVLGGLNTTGVAPYKLRADRSLDEVEYVLGIGGIELCTGVRVPEDLSWEQLLDRHAALFIGLGLGPDSSLGLPGEELDGVEGAVAFIERFKLGSVDLSGVRRAVVLGGGNTAIDAVRELIGLGVEQVRMVYRGDEKRMSGYAHEWKAAKVEGARAVWHAQPVELLGEAGRVSRVRCQRTDAHRQPIPGTEFELSAELVLLAVGQSKLGALLEGLPDVRTQSGRVLVDGSGATDHPRIYAGGDCANGGKEVVNAVAEGRDAAEAIHEFLSGGA